MPPPEGDNRLIVNTPSQSHSRELLRCIRAAKGPISATMHMTAQEKANKALVYRKCERKLARIEDRGNVVIVINRRNTDDKETIELKNSAEHVEQQVNNIVARIRSTTWVQQKKIKPASPPLHIAPHPHTIGYPQAPKKP